MKSNYYKQRCKCKRVIHVVLILLLALWLLACGSNPQPVRGSESKEALVESYLRALKEEMPSGLVDLTSIELDAEQAAQEKIAALGGDKFRVVNVEYIEPIHPSWVRVVIHGERENTSGVKSNHEEVLILHELQGRWYLSLGKSRNTPPVRVPPTSIPWTPTNH
jgi:hypothetical protein